MTVECIDCMGSDLRIANAARVSMGKWHSVFQDSDARLIRYLAREGHWTPFAHVQMTFRVTAPIFVARQLAKHQVGLVANEISRRYVDDAPEFYEPAAWRARADHVKQGSGEAIDDAGFVSATYAASVAHCRTAYTMLLENGVCPEQARMILPLSLMTSWIWTGSLAAFSRVCRLRQDAHAQLETREIADQIAAHCESRFPVAWPALMGVANDAE